MAGWRFPVGRCRTLGSNSAVWAGGVEDACEGAKGQSLLGLALILRPGQELVRQGLLLPHPPAILAAVVFQGPGTQ